MTKVRKKIGTIPINDIEQQVQQSVTAAVGQMQQEVTDFIDEETAKYPEIGGAFKFQEDPESRLEIKTDSEQKIISWRKDDGTLVENAGIETNHLELTEQGMNDFQRALKDAGFQPGGGGDWSDREVIELPEPASYALLNLIVDSLPVQDDDVSEGYAEYYDKAGNYFKLPVSLEAQGQTSRIFALTGGKGNYTADFPTDIKFGSWVPQDSFHLKGCAKDVVRGILPTSYKWAYMFMEYLDAKPNRVLLKDDSETTITHASGDRITDWGDGARCLPDGFPVEVYINGEYWGLYSWQLKKHRKNYSMNKKDYTSFFLDTSPIMSGTLDDGFWTGDIWWDKIDIKNPKDLICMDGSEFDGDHPKELIDDTSEYYDSTNKKHVGSATTKAIIQSFPIKYQEVKNLIDAESIDEAKAKFNEYFDYNTCMLVYIFNCLMKNGDSIAKNTLWGTYNNGKVFFALWDLDAMYGEGWIGDSAGNPSAHLWIGSYATAAWPLALFWTLFESDIKASYVSLRKANIIDINTWKDIVFGWVNRIGDEAYKRDIDKWPETPSYRKNLTNTDYWKENGIVSNIVNGDSRLWNSSTSYAVDSIVVLRFHPTTAWGIRYKAVQASDEQNPQCPVTQFYNGFPQIGGFYDSPKRWEKWMDRQMLLCDVQLGYMDNIVADFIAYRGTDPDYTIQCVDMNLENNLSETYIFIEGHITRHEIEVEDQTISTYTITRGDVTAEDISKTYITVREAVETASQQIPDIPSEEVFCIKAKARNKVFEWKNN
jgi:hypothetical protein